MALISTSVVKIKFRSFQLFVSYADRRVGSISWHGPKNWKAAIDVACKSWVAADGWGGLPLEEYLDALNIGRNRLKDEKAKEKV